MLRTCLKRHTLVFSALVLATGCGDDGTSVTGEDTDAGTGTTMGGDETPTTLTTATPTSGPDTGLDDTTDTDGDACGNGEIDEGEQCDGDNLGRIGCERQGFDSGTLSCTAECTFDSSACCNDACGSDGDTQCNGDTIEVCSIGANGCLAWSAATDCSATNEYCDETRGDASCLPVCVDQCDTDGAARCDGDIIETCSVRAGGCLGWVSGDDCTAAGQYCDDSGDAAACVCDDECTTDGALQCAPNGDAVEICSMAANGCLEWTVDTTCAGDEVCSQAGGSVTCAAPLQYCVPSYASGCGSGDNIDDFIIVDSDQNTVFEHLGTGCSPNAYGDFTQDPALLVPLSALEQYSFTATQTTPTYSQAIKIWIDLNQDGVFDEASELLFESPSGSNPVTGSFVVPATVALPITTRMRVMDRFSAAPVDACNPGSSFGETHDYTVQVVDTDASCEPFEAAVTSVSPANGATTPNTSTAVTVNFSNRVSTSTGVVTVTGSLGTNLSYDLSTNPSAISFSNQNTTMTITAEDPFSVGETVTVEWSGMQGFLCADVVEAVPWTFEIVPPPCVPGQGGLVSGGDQTPFQTGLGSFTEYYVAADNDPNGWLYVGGLTALHRLPKGGGAFDLQSVPGVAAAQLGYDMLIVGSNVFTVESKTTGTDGHLWRISTDGGNTWNVQDFASFPSVPQDKFRSAAHHDGRIYLPTHEATSGVPTEIWSVDLNAPLPVTAVLEGTVPNERHCAGIAVDDTNYYLACGTNDRVVRVNRTTFEVELVTDAWPISLTTASLKGNDVDADGTIDHLYLQSNDRRVFYVCDPAGTPYTDQLATYGASTTTNYGMDFDPVANAVWTYHDASTISSFIRIE